MNRYGGRAAALTGRVWLGLAVGKIAADLAWHGMKASPRRVVPWAVPAAEPATPYLLFDLGRAQDSFAELAAALPGVAVHYAPSTATPPPLSGCAPPSLSAGAGIARTWDGAPAVRLLQGHLGSPRRGGDRARIRRYGRLVLADGTPRNLSTGGRGHR